MPSPPSVQPAAEPSPASGILAAFLEGRPLTAARLRDEHVDDGQGSCAKCPTPTTWPCTVHDAAAAEAARGEC